MSYEIEQLSVFVENKIGELEAILSLLEEQNICMTSIMLSDSSEFGLLRILTNELQKAKEVLNQNGFIAKISSVFAVKIDDHIGSFNKIVRLLSSQNINIKYTYTINEKDEGIFIFKVEEFESAVETLEKNGILLVTKNLLFRS